MAVAIEAIKVGAVFRFKTAARRVTRLGTPRSTGCQVYWEYADGKQRGGRLGGSQWSAYFREDALEIIPDPAPAGEGRQLLPDRRTVPTMADVVEIKLVTHCPAKWAIVDLETGELYGHDGHQFRKLTAAEAADVAQVAHQAAKAS